ncbi:unnamed protein product [Clavelina lepadiformis]|uniref:Fibrinogen C-terminal domain-containing protein n=1 Tax=Clavelina lepadiformis TaxID=159417 RepID=A0ABP0G9Y6_CLALP
MYANAINSAEKAQRFIKLTGFSKECTSIYASGSTSSGIYPIWLKERFQFTYVYCDMELVSTKKGWTTIQRRMNGEVNFNRGWDDYVRGFGSLRGEYWFGLENIYRLWRQTVTIKKGFISRTSPELGVDLEDWDGYKAFPQYGVEWFGPEKTNYRIYVFSLNASGCFESTPIFFNDFSTPDADNDEKEQNHCARENKSGWWFDDCVVSNLNAPYPKHKHPMNLDDIFWEGMFCLNPKDIALRYVSMNFYHTKT